MYRKEMSLTYNEKVVLLKKDILNSPHHVFGNHSNCERYENNIKFTLIRC